VAVVMIMPSMIVVIVVALVSAAHRFKFSVASPPSRFGSFIVISYPTQSDKPD
jgi:hypothetical protein